MKSYDELKALIEQRGVHAEFGDAGEGFAIEQSSEELAAFLVRMQELGVTNCLEIGTGYKGGLSRFLAQDMGWDVTTYDIQNYGHVFKGVHYVVGGAPNFDRRFDLVFIDGDHSYSAVENDFVRYGALADKVVAFHDLLGNRDCMGVHDFWMGLFANHLVDQRNTNKVFDGDNPAGIGWIEL